MSKPMKRAGTALVCGAVLAVTAAPADATSPAESINGNFSYPPFTVQVSAQRAAGAPADAATGSFTGTLALGGTKIGDFQGPVTCLDVEGNSAGMFYPVKSADPSLIALLPFGVFVTVTRTSTGKPLGVTFLPVAETQVSSCAPSQSVPFPITSGSLTFTPGVSSAASTTTLTIRDDVPLGRTGGHANVLANADGETAYMLHGRHPKCTQASGCLRFWRPLTVGAGVMPTKPSNVTGRLGVRNRAGVRQVTLNGHLLYTFAGDTSPGVASGAGIHSFGGIWRVVKTPAALTPTPPSAPSPPPPIY